MTGTALTSAEVISYLLAKRLLTTEDVVDRGVVVDDVSRRNVNLKVTANGGPAYIVKQGAYAETARAVEHEAKIYRALHASNDLAPVANYLPALHHYDDERRVVVIELLRDAHDLRAFHERTRRFSPPVAKRIGRALGDLHRLTSGASLRHLANEEHPHPPWAFALHRPSSRMLQNTSAANVRLIRMLQQFSEFRHLLDHAARQWTASAFIHQDVKWDNFLLVSENGSTKLKIIDWELAGAGDPAWDAGSVFNDYLSFWLNSVPIAGETPPERFLELTRHPIDRMQPAIRAFWDEYVRAAGIDAEARYPFMLKAVSYGGVRLVQSAYEQLQASIVVTGNVVCMLQLAWNILARAAEAAGQLLGLDPLEAAVAA